MHAQPGGQFALPIHSSSSEVYRPDEATVPDPTITDRRRHRRARQPVRQRCCLPAAHTPAGAPTATFTPTPTWTAGAATPTPTHTPTATPTAIPGLVISEVGANPVNTDWNGDGLIDERDRFAEVCNWTGATIDLTTTTG